MSDKIFLKDITLPIIETGENETYSFVQTDSDLETAGDAADAKKVGDELTQLKADLTAVETDIETGNLTAGTSKQLLADTGMTDKSPYLFRAMPTGAGDREEPVIVGGSVVWNQQERDRDPGTATEAGITRTYAGENVIKLSGTASGNAIFYISSNINPFNALANHVYLFLFAVKGTVNNGVVFTYQPNNVSLTNGNAIHKVTADNSASGNIRITVYAGTVLETDYECRVLISDLTVMFGSTIADYVLSLGNAAGLAYLRKYGFFTEDYYPYTEPTFKHVEGLTAHKMVGFNQWDEVWEVGSIDLQTGQNTTYSAAIRSKNYIPVIPSLSYYVKKSGLNIGFRKYGANKEYLGFISANSSETATNFGSDVHFIRFVTNSVTAYNPNNTPICVNLSDPAKNGTYEPYTAHTYPLDPDVVLRGIPKLDSNNNLYFDGDVYKPDGTVTRRYGVVDLGTLTWNTTLSNRAIATIPNMKISTQGSEIVPILSENGYTQIAPSGSLTQIGQFALLMDKRLLFYYDGNTLPSGEIVYELTTPTTETADPYAPLQFADPYGTEEWVLDEDAFPMPVGQETFYPENLRAKIEGLPWNFANLIAPTEASNVATRAYTAGQLFIVDNILYKATTSIASGGTITPGTNCTATTLAEIISALQ